MAKELLKFGYRKSILFPRGENLETSRATRFDRRRMWRSDRGDILRPRDFNDEHLLNTVRYLRRRAFEIVLEEARFQDSMSEASQDAGLPDVRTAEDIYPILPMLCREIARRGLKEKSLFEIDPKKIERPFSVLISQDRPIPIRLESYDYYGKQFVAMCYMGEMSRQPGVGYTKEDLTVLRDTINKILAGWK